MAVSRYDPPSHDRPREVYRGWIARLLALDARRQDPRPRYFLWGVLGLPVVARLAARYQVLIAIDAAGVRLNLTRADEPSRIQP